MNRTKSHTHTQVHASYASYTYTLQLMLLWAGADKKWTDNFSATHRLIWPSAFDHFLNENQENRKITLKLKTEFSIFDCFAHQSNNVHRLHFPLCHRKVKDLSLEWEFGFCHWVFVLHDCTYQVILIGGMQSLFIVLFILYVNISRSTKLRKSIWKNNNKHTKNSLFIATKQSNLLHFQGHCHRDQF